MPAFQADLRDLLPIPDSIVILHHFPLSIDRYLFRISTGTTVEVVLYENHCSALDSVDYWKVIEFLKNENNVKNDY